MQVLAEAKTTLPFDGTCDLEEQARCLLAERTERRIMADAGKVASDMSD